MALTLDNRKDIVRRLTRGESIRGIATAMDCNPSTVQRLKKKLGVTVTGMNTPTPPIEKHTPPTDEMHTPIDNKKHTVTMTCREYAAHLGEPYSVFKHGAGIFREIEI